MNENSEGFLDPWVAEWIAVNGALMENPGGYTPEYLAAARTPTCPFPTRDMAKVTDEVVDGISIRIYEHEGPASGLIVYFHGGAFAVGSIGLMENVATELAHCANATVISVGYRLAPEDPYPAGLDDCETITRWALAQTARFGVSPSHVVVAGESAGGNLAAATTLRLRSGGGQALAGQLLIYPGVAPLEADFPSRTECSGPMLRSEEMATLWAMYSGDRELDNDPFAAPLLADDFSNLPPALVILGGCDVLRDEGRLYGRRLRDAGVASEEYCLAGQPHGFMNLGFPAAERAYERIGTWLTARFS
jgi:acetyl esterase